ncbi:MAG: type II secretion system F family protein [Gemmataceae bacterium]
MTPDEVITLNEQIAAMARAGLPLDQGMRSLARDMNRGRLRRVTEQLATDLKNGITLPEALAKQEGQLPTYYSNLIQAGVRTGRLPEVLNTMTTYARTLNSIRFTILDALFYPAVMFLIAFALLSGMILVIVPKFQEIFKDFGLQVPLMTRFVFRISDQPFQYLFGPILAFLFACFLTWLFFRWTNTGREKWARLMYTIPIVGTMIRAARLHAFTELLGMLVEYEVPLPEAFQLAGNASPDPIMQGKALRVRDELQNGTSLGEAFRGRGLVPEWVAWMSGLGESRGDLGAAFRQVSLVYKRQVEARATVLKTVLPPFIILIVAFCLTGFFAMAILLPMIRLLEGLSK